MTAGGPGCAQRALAAGQLRDDGAVGKVDQGPACVQHGVPLGRVRKPPDQFIGEVSQHVGARDRSDELVRRRAEHGMPGGTAHGVVHEQVAVTGCRVVRHDDPRATLRAGDDVPQIRPGWRGMARGSPGDDAGLQARCRALCPGGGDGLRHRVRGRVVGVIGRNDEEVYVAAAWHPATKHGGAMQVYGEQFPARMVGYAGGQVGG